MDVNATIFEELPGAVERARIQVEVTGAIPATGHFRIL